MTVPYHRVRKDPADGLTPREREIGKLLARAWTNKAIAAEMMLTLPTVKVYVGRVYEKLALTTDQRVNPRVATALYFRGFR